MARPGKAIFDVTMMAGWAFAAVLTGLVALTMVDDTGDSARDPNVVATLDSADARLVTGSIDQMPSANLEKALGESETALVDQQNQTFNPFSKRTEINAQQLQDLIAELHKIKQEVGAFHVTMKRLRDENDRLKQRLAKLELDGPVGQSGSVRVVDLPRRDDSRNPFILANGQISQPIDTQSTGSIGATGALEANSGAFDPFKVNDQPNIKVTEQPLTMDFERSTPHDAQMLPKDKPTEHVASGGALQPVSQVVSAPTDVRLSSQTSFGIDLGAFVSISDIRAAWQEVSGAQKNLVGDLRPLSRVTELDDGRLALHLVLGPIPNAAQAASVCAQLNYANYDCSVSAYRGQSLALN
ncbi:Sporulation related domain-containing protein [Cohaesibacter marisflavi]|uniref:Sporulation related domain-containing protein n=1 Tax=Cohaesibacter marisflavi TaxID=655353 RepID=A0A1I5I9F1_9HYPH|nr:SPOR domain-containing protein [Cohaesibacter marisflavi]SFO56790.1 Sporulation related domain-containing protein [Cohaesibacter marisflavi]